MAKNDSLFHWKMFLLTSAPVDAAEMVLFAGHRAVAERVVKEDRHKRLRSRPLSEAFW
jgi:hypothetical protein